ncbi:pyridoxal phosphate-dependent aminotransferase [Rhodococcus sp. HNM0569]|uniref:pyridoxal phosphate-dependent aminotransferase n=1 Tax=Rhodococcus sp. HNM0569 TaxID=2716340 RepID=UPI001469B234|nr:pyridoxal phosphate-dependent aminotransferase [Rhodococcus sp. HNM0569]NLU83439.1 pyridoxal phosphate-dependent aminotransferase [Rhodococcus sp. HNM0569]
MISSRIRTIQPSATLTVDARAKAMREAGIDVVSFAAGEPDFDTPTNVVEAAIRAASESRIQKYSPAAGLPELRSAVAADSNATVGNHLIGADNVLIANGAKQAIFSALAGIVETGDEVLLPAPYWTTYPELIGFFGGSAVPVSSSATPGNLPSVADLEGVVTDRTKAIVWCSPSNPSGAVADAEHTREVFDWAKEREMWILSDEIYRKLYYGTGTIPTMRALGCPGYSRLVVVDGVSKTYSMTGWRVGWLLADEEFIRGAARLQSHMASNVSNVAQAAATAALQGPQDAAKDMLESFRHRRALITEVLQSIPGIRLTEPDGAFYVFPDVRDAAQRCGAASTQDLAMRLVDEARVAVVPGEAFGFSGHLRLSYALADNQLDAGLRRIVKALT